MRSGRAAIIGRQRSLRLARSHLAAEESSFLASSLGGRFLPPA
jgi:hypothetical protein